MFSQILRQGEALSAKFACESLLLAVDVVVSLKGKLGSEFLAAVGELTFVFLLGLHV